MMITEQNRTLIRNLGLSGPTQEEENSILKNKWFRASAIAAGVGITVYLIAFAIEKVKSRS